MTPTRRSALIRERARSLGFETAGIADLSPVPHADALDRWLRAGFAGTMTYMHRQAQRRKHPSTICPGARHAVVLTVSYYLPDPPPTGRPRTGRVAKYARGADYHRTLDPALQELAAFVRSLGDADTVAVPYVDAGPVPERELAQRAGLGWIGKNTMLIDPRRGSYCFLATVLTNLPLESDRPFDTDRCGTCTRCLDACPTQAFPGPRVLDATRCISYLTIELRGPVAAELQPKMDDWLFGCDVCQDVCPWNAKFATPGGTAIGLGDELAHIALDEFEEMSDAVFNDRYGHTPLERPGLDGLRRNAGIAARNAMADPDSGVR